MFTKVACGGCIILIIVQNDRIKMFLVDLRRLGSPKLPLKNKSTEEAMLRGARKSLLRRCPDDVDMTALKTYRQCRYYAVWCKNRSSIDM